MRTPREALAPDLAGRHRTIFISDVHLGTPGCKAEPLADFLAVFCSPAASDGASMRPATFSSSRAAPTPSA